MKRLKLMFFLLFVVFVPGFALAANHYVRPGAAGANTGTDWTNAYTSLPATLARGDTYYLADGNYSSYTFNDAASATSVITIKKAIASDHGTDAGWSSAYGDGQAVFTTLTFNTGYYTLDGQTGGGPGKWETGFGFRMHSTAPGAKIVKISSGASHVTIRHSDLENSGEDLAGNADTFYVIGGSYLTVSYCWVHNTNRTNFLFDSRATNATIEYSLISERHSTDGTHGELISANNCGVANHVYRYNIFRNSTNTGVIVIKDSVQSGWKIYGNLFYSTSSRYYASNGIITDTTGDSTTNVQVYNNTFLPHVNGLGQPSAVVSWDVSSGNTFVNNVVFGGSGLIGVSSHDYNLWDSQSFASGEAHGQYVSSQTSLFTNPANNDYTVKIATNAGNSSIGSEYSKDMLGQTRGNDGVWDRGAYEYVLGGVPTPSVTPSAPRNLTAN